MDKKTILGDKSITSLLDLVEMNKSQKEAIVTGLPVMNEEDRAEILVLLYQLFNSQVGRKVMKKQAETLAGRDDAKGSLDWEAFARTEEDVLRDVVKGKA